jgi:predicted transcriptional regulator
MWIKMLPNYDRDPNRNKKYYTISRFIGQGVFEAMKTEKGLPVGSPKMIRVKPTESLELSIASASNAANAAQASMVTPGIDPAVAKLLGGQ